jgi:RNA polymerase sigma-B factor
MSPASAKLEVRSTRHADELSDAEVRRLVRAWQLDGDERARERLVERFMPLARRLARRYKGANEPLDDLVQVACFGLVKAIDRFDCSHGAKFSSFAVPTILGELRRYFRDSGWSAHVPRRAQERALAVQKATRELSVTASREPTVAMLAEYLEWTQADVLEGLEAGAAHHSTSLYDPARTEGDDGTELIDTVAVDDEGFEEVDARLTIAEAIRRLPVSTRRAIHLRFVEDLTQSEIGDRLGMSQMQVSRVLRGALDTVRGTATAGAADASCEPSPSGCR